MSRYTVGIDFGTLSGRAILMDVLSGEIVASAVYSYPHAVLDESLPNGTPLPVGTALQHPADYLETLRHTVPAVLRKAGVPADCVVGLGFDFTACTMLPVDTDLKPLCLQERYRSELHSYAKLWKHHTAQREADDLTRIAEERGEPWLKSYGGKVSCEWMIPKIWQILKEAPSVYEDTALFLEAADWISYCLTGRLSHSAPFAGFKALWIEEHGYPSPDFFGALDPRMRDLIGTKFMAHVDSIEQIAGTLNDVGAELTGLKKGTPVSIPVLDAHASMPAVGLVGEGTMMLILGTSGVQMIHSAKKQEIPGICGVIKDGVVPGLYTYEAGQACCGDHFDWFVKNGIPYAYHEEANRLGMGLHQFLREKAKKLCPGESGLLALDWFNGNRSVLSDSSLSGMILGLTLRTKPEEIYRALIEGTAYGTRIILETFESAGVGTERIIAAGGIAEKDEMLMQIYADVLDRPITVSSATMSASRGSAIYATVAAEVYPDLYAASRALAICGGKTYEPIPENVEAYRRLYAEYKELHDYFGKGGNSVMKRLCAMRDQK